MTLPQIDLLLADAILPDISWVDLAGRLAANRPARRLLYTSGYTGDALLRHGLAEARSALVRRASERQY